MKEWKGNSNSAHAAIAAKKPGSKTVREENDFYATDPKAIEALFNAPCYSHTQVTELYLKNGKNDPYFYIWECAAGISKSQQYKMAGNSIVVNCLAAIFRQLFIGNFNKVVQTEIF